MSTRDRSGFQSPFGLHNTTIVYREALQSRVPIRIGKGSGSVRPQLALRHRRRP
jgi:hypothetical protein